MLLGFVARRPDALLLNYAVLVPFPADSVHIIECLLFGLIPKLFSEGAIALLLGCFCFLTNFLCGD
jgi:hypothetical protein